MIKRLDKSKALKRFGLAAILLRMITIVMHLMVISKVLPYTWVSGGQINDYNTAVETAGASIVILLTSIAIYTVTCGFFNIKLVRWMRIALIVLFILQVPFDLMGVILQFLGTDFERHVTSMLAILMLLADSGVAVLYYKKLYDGRKNNCGMRE